MILERSEYRKILESSELAKNCWFNGRLGNPAFEPNQWAIMAQKRTMEMVGSNWYVTETPETVTEAAIEFLQNIFGVTVTGRQIQVSTMGTRSWPGFITLWFRGRHSRPMQWLAEQPGYPGHSIIIEQYGGKCRRVGRPDCSYLQILEEMERSDELNKFDAIIAQAVINPTAKVASPETVQGYANLASRTGKLLLFDGAYQCVTGGNPVPSPLRRIEAEGSNIVCLHSTSKGDQFASLGYGFGYGDPEWLKAFADVQSATREGGNLACFAALEACLRHPEFLKKTSQGYSRLGSYFRNAMGEAGIEVPEWEGSIFSYFRIPEACIGAGRDSFDFALDLAKLGVGFYPDYMFFGKGEWIRATLPKGLEQESIRSQLAETVSSLVRGQLVSQ